MKLLAYTSLIWLLIVPVDAAAPGIPEVPTGCAPVPDGLIAWWPGEGSAEDIFGANEGTLKEGIEFGPGFFGRAFKLDGINDYVETSVDLQPSTVPETTWEAWIFPTRIRHGSRQQILSIDDGSYDRSLLIESGGDKFGVFTGFGVWQPTAVTTNEWQHVAVVFTADNIRFYKNGEEFSMGKKPGLQATSRRLRIGSNPGFGEYFQGLIDEVSVYSRALSVAEIQAIHVAGAAGKCPATPGVGLQMAIQSASSGVAISWRGTELGWILQSTDLLTTQTSWVDLPTPPILVSGRWTVAAPFAQPSKFYRLIRR